jgi:hypothetical protein
MIGRVLAVALAACVVMLAGVRVTVATAAAVRDPIPDLPAARRAQEAAFLRTVDPLLTADRMTSDVLAYVHAHVAFICEVEELTRPGVVVGQCGTEGEPVDLYLKLPGTWHKNEKLRVLGIMDTPASWSDVDGHTIYYPFVRAVYVDRLQ